ncbi:MAG: DISARM system phospholipase D-like protein DrmC [Myxococcota bacterium]|jgi:phosphatidylserine/phosphatidylglycerophosphate/cardiolipin synthase-like enzyme|nr:DISARM system phospholipase D-like protein DrmC [Myxococcota bacterium]
MDDSLFDAVSDLVALVSPTKVRTVAAALRGLASPESAPNPNTLVDTPAARAAVERVIACWASQGCSTSSDELAGILLGACETRLRVERELSIELVWTGPTTRFVPMRRTEQVLVDLVASATSSVFFVSFVAFGVHSVVTALDAATRRGVRVRFLIESSTKEGGTLKVNNFASFRKHLPQAELLTWTKRKDYEGGKVHAKIAVVDEARAFITSANLTGHALEKNMEVGVLMHGGPVPRAIALHLDALVEEGFVAPI